MYPTTVLYVHSAKCAIADEDQLLDIVSMIIQFDNSTIVDVHKQVDKSLDLCQQD